MSNWNVLQLINTKWRTTILVAVAVALIYVPYILLGTDMRILFFTLIIIAPMSAIVSLILIMVAFPTRKNRMMPETLASGFTIALVSATMLLTPYFLGKSILAFENKAYWTLGKKKYKEELRLQHPVHGDSSHVLLRLWGFVGGTDVWIVFDPSDRLGDFRGYSGLAPNIPCPVWGIEELAKNYYVVYDDDHYSWDNCPDDARPQSPAFLNSGSATPNRP